MNDGIAFKLFADYSEYYSKYIHLSNNHKFKRLSFTVFYTPVIEHDYFPGNIQRINIRSVLSVTLNYLIDLHARSQMSVPLVKEKNHLWEKRK
jgi:hypothetical protein